jgi:hypothetical protein
MILQPCDKFWKRLTGQIGTIIRFALNVESRCDTKSGSKMKSGLFGTR